MLRTAEIDIVRQDHSYVQRKAKKKYNIEWDTNMKEEKTVDMKPKKRKAAKYRSTMRV